MQGTGVGQTTESAGLMRMFEEGNSDFDQEDGAIHDGRVHRRARGRVIDVATGAKQRVEGLNRLVVAPDGDALIESSTR